MYNAVKSLHKTLNAINVTGKENLSRLLGCIELTEKIIEAMERVRTSNDGNCKREDSAGGLDVVDGKNRRTDDGV